MEVFAVLRYGVIKKQALDTNLNTETETPLQLQLPQLQFLLSDLVSKLQHKLVATQVKRASFLKVGSSSTLLLIATPVV